MIITGVVRLGRDAESKVTSGGTAVVSFTAAYSYGKKGEDGQRPTQWIAFEFFGARAEAVAPYLAKGAQVWIAASNPRIRSYDKKDGSQGVALEATVQELQLVGGKPAGGDAPQAERRPAAAPSPARTTSGHSRFDALEDDIPFN
jgi:single-strand DNA-binding protein